MPQKVAPLPREAIEQVDAQLAKQLLVEALRNIPESAELWRQARETREKIIRELEPTLRKRLAGLSPEGRGALVSLGLRVDLLPLYEENAVREAADVAKLLTAFDQVVNIGDSYPDLVQAVLTGSASVEEVLQKVEDSGFKSRYRAGLEAIVEPLGVPGLVDLMMLRDMVELGFHRLLYDSGPIEGPARDLLETFLLKGLGDLGPADLAKATPGQIRKRMMKKMAPLLWHLQRHDLVGRVQLWLLNVVYGKTIDEISRDLQQDEQRLATGVSPFEWVREQVQEASRIVGFKRQGRPRKGGGLAPVETDA